MRNVKERVLYSRRLAEEKHKEVVCTWMNTKQGVQRDRHSGCCLGVGRDV